ncbi:MAG TPA: hypothetical protein ENG70_03195 [Candidatus Cloacimonetes bacterium]|nr:hypothetical protein [Candidatus Cloacimonadota bacterium]HEX37850.1 hypothetical protein [Candidatus Cloacimonadota bacterium]
MTNTHISIRNNFSIKSGNYIYSDFYEHTQEKAALILNTYESSKKAEKAIAVLLQVFKDQFHKDSYDISSRLKETIREMNWHLTAFFNREKCKFEVSALICVIKNDTAYFAQTGRLLIYCFDKSFSSIGLDIENNFKESFQIPILGIKEGELQIKVHSHKLTESTDILIIPFKQAKELSLEFAARENFLSLIDQLFSDNVIPLAHISARERHSKYKSRLKFRLTSKTTGRIMLIVIIIATAYVIFGRKWAQGLLSSGKEVISEKKKFLIDYKSLFPNLPQPAFEVKEWEWLSPKEITLPPKFDVENLYFITDNELTCIKKNTYQLKWKATFNDKIRTAESLRNEKLLIVDAEDNHYLLDKTNGKIKWNKNKPSTPVKYIKESPHLIVLDYIRDGRLEQNYYILVDKNTIQLVLAEKGDVIAMEEFGSEIDFISEYDYIEKCFYVTMGRKVIKIDLILI